MFAKEELYRRALDFLYKRTNYETFKSIPYEEMAANLRRLKDFLAFLGDPQQNFAIVHIAGTKGKGTTCAALDQILRAGGYRVGLFTSPHLDEVTERVQIDGRNCDKGIFAETLLELSRLYARFSRERGESKPLTFFEWTLVLALAVFARAGVDVAILETGLGGRFDATNVCDADVSAITGISFDHCEQLGDSLTAIATEKAGIIKTNAPVVCGVGFSNLLAAKEKTRPGFETSRSIEPETTISRRDVDDVVRLIRERAESFGAPFYRIDSISPVVESFPTPPFDDVSRWNFEIALKISEILATRTSLPQGRAGEPGESGEPVDESIPLLSAPRRFPVSASAVAAAASRFRVPCRFEQVSESPLVFVDGAHNRASVAAFVQAALDRFPGKKIKILFATTVGKDVRGMLAETIPFVDELMLSERGQEGRALTIDKLIQIAESVLDETFPLDAPERRRVRVIPDYRAFLTDYFSRPARPDVVLCAIGSFYFAAAVKKAVRSAAR